MLSPWSDGNRAPLCPGTVFSAHTKSTVFRRKLYFYNLILEPVNSRGPAAARLPRWAKHLLGVPVNCKVTRAEAFALLTLSGVTRTGRSNKINTERFSAINK